MGLSHIFSNSNVLLRMQPSLAYESNAVHATPAFSGDTLNSTIYFSSKYYTMILVFADKTFFLLAAVYAANSRMTANAPCGCNQSVSSKDTAPRRVTSGIMAMDVTVAC